MGRSYPILADRFEPAGNATGHYFHQDLWAARKIHAAAPDRHVDVGSRIDGFVAHLLVFRSVEVIDIRALESPFESLKFTQADATSLSGIESNSVESLSSLHAVEHFGLGRYGDPIDVLGPFKAMDSLARVLAPAGTLYLSVPVGRERVEFNAHRIFNPERIIQHFKTLDLIQFCVVDSKGVHADVPPGDYRDHNEVCGLFEFRKPR